MGLLPLGHLTVHSEFARLRYLGPLPSQLSDESQRDTIYRLLTIDYVHEALTSGTRILVIGNPRIEANFYDRPTLPFLHWTGYDFTWKSVGGDTKEILPYQERFGLQSYLERISRWEYALISTHPSNAYEYASMVQNAKRLKRVVFMSTLGLAKNRNDELISFALILQSYKENDYGITDQKQFAPIVFIPLGVSDSPEEDLRFILKDTLDISIAQEPPDWILEMEAPGQSARDHRISEIKMEIANHQAQLATEEAARAELRKCLDVLYQIGGPLETAVKNLLRELGGTIEEPPVKGFRDAYLTISIGDELQRAVLEIKGTSKAQFDMKGFKQVLQWRDEAMIDSGEKYRAIFIGNSAIDDPPYERDDPFGDGWIKQTRLHKVTALSTSTLYEAYCAFKTGKLDIVRFWNALFGTDGVVSFHSLS